MCLNLGRITTAKILILKFYFIGGENDKGDNDRGCYCNYIGII